MVPVLITVAIPKLINRGMNWITHLGQLWVSGIGGVWLLGAIEISGARYTRVHVPVQLVKSKSCSVVSDSLRPHGLYSPWNSPSQNAGVGSLSLLQGIIPTQESNWGLPHCRRILHQLSCQHWRDVKRAGGLFDGKVPMQYCSLQHRALLLSPVTSTAGYCFALAPSLHSFWSYFSTDLQ